MFPAQARLDLARAHRTSSDTQFISGWMIALPAHGQRRRIGLLGQFGIGNLGNEGSLSAMLSFLRSVAPDADLVCICSDPEFVSRAHGVAAIPMRAPDLAGPVKTIDRLLLGMLSRVSNVTHTLRVCAGLDVLLVPGTGVLDDFGARPGGFPYELWRWCRGARLFGAKVGMVSIGAGPIRNGLSRVLMRGAARSANYRSFRDDGSKAFARSIGIDVTCDPVFPDLAFSLPAPDVRRETDGSSPLVALGVMSYFGWKAQPEEGAATYAAYVEKIAQYAHWLVATGRRVRLVIGSSSDVKTTGDVRTAVARIDENAARGIEICSSADLNEVMMAFSQADIAVVTRFHNLVCALRVGCPAISLGYSEKNDELLRQFGMGQFSYAIENFDLEILKRKTEEILAASDRLRPRLRDTASRNASQLTRQEALLAAEFLQ